MKDQATPRPSIQDSTNIIIKEHFDELLLKEDCWALEYIPKLKSMKEYAIKAIKCHDELVEALKLCANVLAGNEMKKQALIMALEKSKQALSNAGEL